MTFRIGKKNGYLFFILLLIFCIYQYGVKKICGFTLYPDEFGYWASAANAVGYDWSEVASMGAYYSFGYSLILIPLLKLFSGGVTAYRAAIAVNMLLMCFAVFLLLKIIEKLFPEVDEVQKVLLSGIAVLYPPWIFYMQMTMAEALLSFLFVLIFFLFLSFVEKPNLMTAVGLAVTFVYIYCVHMRTVAVVLAGVVTLFLWGTVNPKGRKHLVVLVCALALLMCGVVEIKECIIMEVFSRTEKELLMQSGYAIGQWKKLEKILTPYGIRILFYGVIGKIFYMGISSFGIFYWFIGWCIRQCAELVKNVIHKEIIPKKQWGAFFLLLTVCGETMISSIYMFGADKIDGLVYGRYNDLFMPVILITGIVVMRKSKLLIPMTFILGMVNGSETLLLLDIVEKIKLNGFRGYHTAGISYLMRDTEWNYIVNFRDIWIFGFEIMIFVAIFICMSKKWNGRGWIWTGILFIEIIAGMQLSSRYTYSVNRSNYENQVIVEVIKEKCGKSDSVLFLDEGYSEIIDFLQMQLPDKPIQVMDVENFQIGDFSDAFLITDIETRIDEKLQKIYDKKVKANTFCLYYNSET